MMSRAGKRLLQAAGWVAAAFVVYHLLSTILQLFLEWLTFDAAIMLY